MSMHIEFHAEEMHISLADLPAELSELSQLTLDAELQHPRAEGRVKLARGPMNPFCGSSSCSASFMNAERAQDFRQPPATSATPMPANEEESTLMIGEDDVTSLLSWKKQPNPGSIPTFGL